MILFLFAACFLPCPDDSATDTADTAPVPSTPCLVLTPDTVDLSATTPLAYVAYTGCTDGLAVTCDAPFTASPSAAVAGSLLVTVTSAPTEDTEGACTVGTLDDSATVAVRYLP